MPRFLLFFSHDLADSFYLFRNLLNRLQKHKVFLVFATSSYGISSGMPNVTASPIRSLCHCQILACYRTVLPLFGNITPLVQNLLEIPLDQKLFGPQLLFFIPLDQNLLEINRVGWRERSVGVGTVRLISC